MFNPSLGTYQTSPIPFSIHFPLMNTLKFTMHRPKAGMAISDFHVHMLWKCHKVRKAFHVTRRMM
ncbi:hypothetical protein T02_2940 [Trichinella nativa]|uniref:Uncharacterized protein n=1 Tax=Trichinella nativa TaxID=6335 RepID=A0A0V1L8W7_9BILA|nr:hypothetical protein T02_2940 [Trichinella nativa]